jgi:hypothetical protein
VAESFGIGDAVGFVEDDDVGRVDSFAEFVATVLGRCRVVKRSRTVRMLSEDGPEDILRSQSQAPNVCMVDVGATAKAVERVSSQYSLPDAARSGEQDVVGRAVLNNGLECAGEL